MISYICHDIVISKIKNGELDGPHFGKTTFRIRILRHKGSKAGVGVGNSKVDVDNKDKDRDRTESTVLGNNKADNKAVLGADNDKAAVFHHKVYLVQMSVHSKNNPRGKPP